MINQGDALIRGEFDSTMALKIGLTFLVPFVVATISGAAAIRVQMRRDQADTQIAGQAKDHDLRADPPANRRE